MPNPLPWSPQPKEDRVSSTNDVLESTKSGGKQKEGDVLEQSQRKPRQKIEKDVGSRWVAPILLIITILVSLLLKLFNRN